MIIKGGNSNHMNKENKAVKACNMLKAHRQEHAQVVTLPHNQLVTEKGFPAGQAYA
jgi:hypothetical protein